MVEQEFFGHTFRISTASGHSSAAISASIPYFPWEPASNPPDHIRGFEASDLATVLSSLERLRCEGFSGPVGYICDNASVVDALNGGNLTVWWEGANYAPRILAEIESRARYFDLVAYEWLPRRANPAGHTLRMMQARQHETDSSSSVARRVG